MPNVCKNNRISLIYTLIYYDLCASYMRTSRSPLRAYFIWEIDEDDELINRLISQQSIDQIAAALERSPTAISRRVTKLLDDRKITIIRS